MRNVFLRAQQMTAEISGEKVVCRGVVHRLKEDKTALQAETETFGGAMKPLYVYFGDGKVLCGTENARLTVGGETFRVLYAEEKSGICGALYVRAVLEKEEKDDGNGAQCGACGKAESAFAGLRGASGVYGHAAKASAACRGDGGRDAGGKRGRCV